MAHYLIYTQGYQSQSFLQEMPEGRVKQEYISQTHQIGVPKLLLANIIDCDDFDMEADCICLYWDHPTTAVRLNKRLIIGIVEKTCINLDDVDNINKVVTS